MRPVREITSEEENFRVVRHPALVATYAILRDPVEPEPVGTIILKAFRIVGYDRDLDGESMARLAAVDRDGGETGWSVDCVLLYPDATLVVTPEELKLLFEGEGRS